MTPRSPHPSRSAHFTAALVASLSAAATGLACGGRAHSKDRVAPGSPGAIDTAEAPALPPNGCGGGAQGTCNPPDAAAVAEPEGCPESLPFPGADCLVEGQTCSYRTECVGFSEPDTATCRFGQWLVQYPPRANCDPAPIQPLCPQREIVADAGCAYEEQTCSREMCLPGPADRQGHQCRDGSWRAVSLSCPREDDTF